jgi:oligopeptidase B
VAGTVFNEIKTRTQETDLSVPARKGGYWYYTRTVEGQQYGILCRAVRRARPPRRRPATAAAAGRAGAAGRQRRGGRSEFFALGTFDVSPDGSGWRTRST